MNLVKYLKDQCVFYHRKDAESKRATVTSCRLHMNDHFVGFDCQTGFDSSCDRPSFRRLHGIRVSGGIRGQFTEVLGSELSARVS